jgi:hypothetical protein
LLFTREKNRILAEIFAIFTFLERQCPETSYPSTLIGGSKMNRIFGNKRPKFQKSIVNYEIGHPYKSITSYKLGPTPTRAETDPRASQ